jgi:hypothetical protein
MAAAREKSSRSWGSDVAMVLAALFTAVPAVSMMPGIMCRAQQRRLFSAVLNAWAGRNVLTRLQLLLS